MRKDGRRIIIEPAPKSLLAVLAEMEPYDEDFPEIPELPHDPVDL